MTGSCDPAYRPSRQSLAYRALRGALLFAAAALAIPALSAAPDPAVMGTTHEFMPPGETMVLTRTLRRELPGGSAVSTSRSYEIRFVRDGTGYRIDGQLIDVKVEVPPAFESLAALERARVEKDMFPMHVDASGHFDTPEVRHSPAFAEQASRTAQAQVPATLPAETASRAHAFIASVGSAGFRTVWPDDLFSPAAARRREKQAIAMEGGGTGEVAIEVDADTDAATGLLSMLQRIVTTRLGGSAQVTVETWTLARKG